ncbi:hypothetical protein C4D60_Mb08t28050 [Musa balbisiana]|uniref:Uncharacterized protein n=1 Tax=Musa balbisiana TaxID=52838 RepID=A0A4S8K725_MUSBA|nr:hypothetical protein C4D60_Mb08t28050 [Musa balbisiana]
MEIPQHSTNDSFSYSWLMNVKSPLDSAQEDGSSFIEVDPKVFSMRWKTDSLDFDFHLPTPRLLRWFMQIRSSPTAYFCRSTSSTHPRPQPSPSLLWTRFY